MTSLQKNICFLSVLVLAFFMTFTKISDYGIWQVLLEGKYLSSGGSVFNGNDPFSYYDNSPYNIGAPLGALVMYGLFSVFGDVSVTFLSGSLLASSLLIIYITLQKRFDSDNLPGLFPILIAIIIALFALRLSVSGIMSYGGVFFLSLTIYLCEKLLKGDVRFLYYLILVELLAVNFCGVWSLYSMLYLLIFYYFNKAELCGTFSYEGSDEQSFEQSNDKLVLALFAASLLVFLLNPRGYLIFTDFLRIIDVKLFLDTLLIWQSFDAKMFFGSNFTYSFAFLILIISIVMLCIVRPKQLRLSDYVSVIVFLLLTVIHVGLILPLVVCSVIPLSFLVSYFMKSGDFVSSGYKSSLITIIFVLFISTLIIVFIVNSKSFTYGAGFKTGAYPVKAINFVEKVGLKGKIYNSLNFGSYINYRLGAGLARHYRGINFYSKDNFLTYMRDHGEPGRFDELAAADNIEMVILEYERDFTKLERMKHLYSNKNWALVYWDREAIIFAKRGGQNDSLINAYEYVYVKPNDFDKTYLKNIMISESYLASNLVNELERTLAFNADNEEARIYMAFMYYSLGLTDNEYTELVSAVKLNPNLVLGHIELGKLYYAYYKFDLAKKAFETALSIDPYNEQAIAGLKLVREGRAREDSKGKINVEEK